MSGETRARVEAQAALAALDRALQSKPKSDGHAFTEMTKHLCTLRDLLIADRRADAAGGRDLLERVNAIISTALAGHFPLGNIPWPEIEHARGALQELLAQL